ncbi:unnamed protein product [Gongylonema pulchrum]|uniref:Uncharacterized protein n=1 Tax=Gongylonema pulchrum TaxID=637853 RepID=A0A183ECJ9_9BILA|nr:unnamed protein product [Gongylonema pulchrum]
MMAHRKTAQWSEHQRRPNVPRSAMLSALALSTAAISKKNHTLAAAAEIISRARSAPDIEISGSDECGRRLHSNLNSELDFQSPKCLSLETSEIRNIDQQKLQPFQQFLGGTQTIGTSNNEQQKNRSTQENGLSSNQHFEPKRLLQGYSNFQQLENGIALQMETKSLQDEQQQSNLPLPAFPALPSFLREQSQKDTSAAQTGFSPIEPQRASTACSFSDQQQQAEKSDFSFSEPVVMFPCPDRIFQRNPEEIGPAAHSSGRLDLFFHQNPGNTRAHDRNPPPRETLKACIHHRMKKVNGTNPSTGQPLSDMSETCQCPQILHPELEKQTNLFAILPASAGFCTGCSAIQPIVVPPAISRNRPTQYTEASVDNGVGYVSHEEAYAASVLSEMEADLLDWVISSTLQTERPNPGQVPTKTKEVGSAGGGQATPDLRTLKQSECQLEIVKTDLENAAGHSSFASHEDVVGQLEALSVNDFDNVLNCAALDEFHEVADWFENVFFENFFGLKNNASNSENTSSEEKSTVITDRKKKIEGENSRPKRVKMQHIEQDLSPGNATFLQSVLGHYPEGVSNINVQHQ